MFRIRLAGITVEIDNRHNFVYELCKDYLCFDSVPPSVWPFPPPRHRPIRQTVAVS